VSGVKLTDEDRARIFGWYYAPWVRIAREAYWARLGLQSLSKAKSQQEGETE